MMRAAKWVGIILAAAIVLIIAAVLIVPALVDLNAYKPEIEKKVADATGRPFVLGGGIKLSLFPWAGVALSDLRLGNPPGFKAKDFVSVKSFEVRVKVLPLIRRNLEVERFVVVGPRINLLRDQKGRANWEGLGKAAPPQGPKEQEAAKGPSELPIAALAVGEFTVKDGLVSTVDELAGTSREISDIQIALADVSLDKPIRFKMSARMEGRPVSMEGTMGPVGKIPGFGTVNLEMTIKALGELTASIKGKVEDPALGRRFDMTLKVDPFSPRKAMELLGEKFPLDTSDPQAISRAAANLRVVGDAKALEVKEALLELDETKITLSAALSEFHKPRASFDVGVDRIDLDRYLPKEPRAGGNPKTSGQGGKGDMSGLRKPVIEGNVRIGALKAKGAKVENIVMKLAAKDGIFEIRPLSMDLYKGKLAVKARCDMSGDTPSMSVELLGEGIQAGPLLKDVAKKDFLEGTLKASMDIRTKGADAGGMKRNLNGKTEVVFSDGALVGIDIAGMIRDAKVTLGLAEKTGERPRTDFSELRAPFIIENGVARTEETTMNSPLLRLLAKGSADLAAETLDFRVEPKLVATLKGQGDEKERAGLTVPLLVKGTFSAPSIAPDLQRIITQGLEKGLKDPSKLKEDLKQSLPKFPAMPGNESPLRR
jgi:AsmA protein